MAALIERVDLISSGAIPLPPTPTGYRGALMVRDPDGHAVLFVSH